MPAPTAIGRGRPILKTLGRWAPTAAAAALLLAAIVVFQLDAGRPQVPGQVILQTALVDRFHDRHDECARLPSHLMEVDSFPKSFVALPAAIADRLGATASAPLDLTTIGYAFDAAGKCNVPGDPAVHLVYRATDATNRHDALSLWIRKYEKQPEIEAGRIYLGTSADDSQPVLLWRLGEMMYYLTGDASSPIRDTARVLARGV